MVVVFPGYSLVDVWNRLSTQYDSTDDTSKSGVDEYSLVTVAICAYMSVSLPYNVHN